MKNNTKISTKENLLIINTLHYLFQRFHDELPKSPTGSRLWDHFDSKILA